MATIGQTFSPGMLAALTGKEEGRKNRNMQAALADRQNKIAVDSANAGIKVQNAQLQQRAEQAHMGGAQAKQQMEALKEQGRNDRADRGNELRKALEGAKLDIKAGEAESRQALRAVQADVKTGQAQLAQATFLSTVEQAQAKAELLKSQGQTEEARKENYQQLAAINRERAENFSKTAKVRRSALKALAKNHLSIIENREAKTDLAKATQKFDQAMKTSNFELSVKKMEQAIFEYETTANLYNQTLFDRMDGAPKVANAMAKIAGVKDWLASARAQLDNAIRTGSHNPNRVAPSGPKPKPQPGGVGAAGADAGDVFDDDDF